MDKAAFQFVRPRAFRGAGRETEQDLLLAWHESLLELLNSPEELPNSLFHLCIFLLDLPISEPLQTNGRENQVILREN